MVKDNAEKFVAHWLAQSGSERSMCQQFWAALLSEVLGHRYSKKIGYYSFPKPNVARLESASCHCGGNDGRANTPGSPQSEIEKTAQAILDEWQNYVGAFFSKLYGEKIYLFADLVAAHDATILKTCGWSTDLAESEIISRLFEMYAGMMK